MADRLVAKIKERMTHLRVGDSLDKVSVLKSSLMPPTPPPPKIEMSKVCRYSPFLALCFCAVSESDVEFP